MLEPLPVGRAMIDELPEWGEWLSSHQSIKSKIRNPKRTPLESRFLTMHAVTESYFRRVLFVGLRLNYVTYKEAGDWLFHHDKTPDRKYFASLFDKLYHLKNLTWNVLLEGKPTLMELWGLWLDYAKVIRNHISHGIRSYSDECLICGMKINQKLIVDLDDALAPFIGGSIAKGLDQLSPRLPRGRAAQDMKVLTGRKLSKPKPKVSLTDASSKIEGIILQAKSQTTGSPSN